MNINEAFLMRRIGGRSFGRTGGRGREAGGVGGGELLFVSGGPH